MWFRTYRWHSVNLVPIVGAVDICEDEAPNAVFRRDYSINLFGRIFVLELPTKRFRLSWDSPVVGPLWSRRKKRWYWPTPV